MTGALQVMSNRYVTKEPQHLSGDWAASAATDRKLRRPVRVWSLNAPAGDHRTDEVFALARRCCRLSHPAFMPVLDIVREPDRLSVILGAPTSLVTQTKAPRQHVLAAPAAVRLTLDTGTAIAEAESLGLQPAGPLLSHIEVDDGGNLYLDPIGLFQEAENHSGPSGPIALLCDLLEDLRQEAGTRWDGPSWLAADNVNGLLDRWRQPPDSTPSGSLSNFLADLSTVATSAGGFVPDAGSGVTRWDATMPLQILVNGPVTRGDQGSIAAGKVHAAPTAGLRAVITAAVLIGLLGFAGARALGSSTWWGATPAPEATTAALANRATLRLAAQQDANVRVTIDGAQAYSGMLRAGESRTWSGVSRVQVWTTGGKVLLVTVNGHELGPLSTAIGHPEWNTVDWGWQAGWRP